MKKLLSIIITVILVSTMSLSSFANESTETIIKKDLDADKTEFYFINNKLYIKVQDAMKLLGYQSDGENRYKKEGKIVEFNPENLTISFAGMPKVVKGDLQNYGKDLIISANGLEEYFSKYIITTGNFAKFKVTNSVPHQQKHWTEHQIIAHAMGGFNGMVKTNSLDAMRENYKKGHRVFEADLLLTADGKLVASPGFYEYQAFKYGKPIPLDKQEIIPSLEEFLSFRPNGTLQTIDFENIVKIMSANKDMYLITDTKSTDFLEAQKQFKELVAVCKSVDASVLDRIIPQIYNEQMYDAVKNQYDFKSIIYTLYTTTSTNAEALEFAASKGIQVVTMAPERINPIDIATYNLYGIKVYTHTINTLEEIKKYKAMGVYGFYSDFITPDELYTLN